MSNELKHHGVKGQKWGVRRYQNKDGSLTTEGQKLNMYRRRTINANKTSKDVEDIISTMSKDEKHKLCLENGEKYLTFEQGSSVAKRIIEKNKDTPTAWFDILDDGDSFQVALGTRSGQEYRGKGYASKCTKRGMEWFNDHQDIHNKIVWGVRVDNKPSIQIAKNNGFKLDKDSYSDDGSWVNYVYKK